jgi:hypothetical protein
MSRLHDSLPPPQKKPEPLPFNIPAGRIPVLDHKKIMRGHVGPKATEATLPRFGLKHGGSLQTCKGRTCWVGNGPTLAQTSAEGTNPAIPLPQIGGKP